MFFKRVAISALMLLALGYRVVASAHTLNASLGAAAGTIDFYLISCSTGDANGARLEVSVINQAASSPLLSVQMQKNDLAVNSTDAASGNSAYSPTVPLTGGDGVYYVTVDKSGAGSVNYSLEYHCKTGGGLHTGDDTSLILLQNDTASGSTPGPDPDPNPNPNPGSQIDLQTTDVKDEATESSTHYTGFVVTHGCQDVDQLWRAFSVIAVNSVFPNSENSVAYKIDPDTKAESLIDPSEHLEGAIGGGLPGLAPGMVQNKSVFKKQREILDDSGRVRGIQFYGGKLGLRADAVLPFRVSAPKFLANSCAKSLKVRIAVANWCEKSKADPNRADIWMGHMTSLFNDPAVMPDNSPYWPTLIVNRTTALPAEEDCPDGHYFDIAVQPSDADIDRFLPIKGYWPE